MILATKEVISSSSSPSSRYIVQLDGRSIIVFRIQSGLGELTPSTFGSTVEIELRVQVRTRTLNVPLLILSSTSISSLFLCFSRFRCNYDD